MTDADPAPATLDPRRLLIFREVARGGSLSAAAAALGWTQPAVGQHMSRLERDVGLALLHRSPRGVALTDAGTVLLGHADALAGRLAAATDEMQGLRTLRTGRLRVAAFPSACATLVPAVTTALAAGGRDVDVRVTELEPPEALAAVLAGDADLALVFDYPAVPEPLHPDLVGHRVLDEPLLAVLPADHRLARRRRVAIADLAGERWVAGCPRCRRHLEAAAETAGFVPDVRHSTDDYVVVQHLVVSGLGVALLPRLALEAARDPRVVAVPLAGDPGRRVHVVHRREATSVPAVRAAVRALTGG